MIDPKDWIWKGTPGHYILANRCCFRLHTQIGQFRISTVGCCHESLNDYYNGVVLPVTGNFVYETQVFLTDEKGMPVEWANPLVSEGCNEEKDAINSHNIQCYKYSLLGKVH